MKWLNIGKINVQTRDDRSTLWYKICKSVLTQIQDSVSHLFGGKVTCPQSQFSSPSVTILALCIKVQTRMFVYMGTANAFA